MDVPGFTEDRHTFGVGREQRLDVCVVLHCDILLARGAKGGYLCVLERVLLQQLKELHVLRVGAGVARLDIIDLKLVKNARNFNFILYGKGDANALRAVAQR